MLDELAVCGCMHGLASFALPNYWHRQACRALKSPKIIYLIISMMDINGRKPTRQVTTLDSSGNDLMVQAALI